ncbi:MAG TPA: sulfatase-like hydrolase/transferase [Thermoanaerobaculia bacterium]|nr:sulfatase-like hydrolase/transferase [Thermoanaerobaculia bacterium]
MSRRLLFVLVLALLAVSCRRERKQETFENPPVILISIDTLRADHLPLYGYSKVETPNIDALRRDGVLFENAYSHCPMTLPSHVSMLSGLLPTEHEVRNNLGYRFDATKHITLPQLLKQRGYATGAAVSSYVLRGETGLRDAFDFYDDAIPVATNGAASQHQRAGSATLAVTKRWIAEHQSSPFFFLFHLYEPHAPYAPPEPFRSRYTAQPYDGEIATADALVGELFADLKQSGLYDRALIILTSDHGEGLWEHGEDQHGILLYREVLHVPLIVKLPDSARKGGTVKAPVALIDLFPTVASLVGAERPESLKGMPIVALLDDPKPPSRAIYSETFYPRIHLGWSELRSLVDAQHHYIQGPRAELYDIVADPRETKEISANERRATASLREELAKYPAGIQELQTIDPEDAAKLAALGYVGSAKSPTGNEPLPNPRDMLPYLARIKSAFKLADEHRLGEAVVVLQQLVKENPGLFDAWDKLGELLAEMGRYDESIRVYREAMSRAQRFSPEMALSVGDTYLKNDQPDEAEKYAQLALKSTPANAHALLARVAMQRHDFATAEREAQEAIGTENPQPTAMLLVADVKRARGDLAGALAAADAAAARARELNVEHLYRLDFIRGDVLARMDRVDESVAAYQREIANFPQNTQAYANLAIIYFIQGRRADVDRLLEKMVAENPHRGAYALAAKTMDSLEDRAAAARWRERANRLR